MSLITVDASVVAKLLFEELHTEKAVALFDDSARRNDYLIAPPLLPYEISNVIRKRMRSQRLTLADAVRVIETFEAQPIRLLELPGALRQALTFAERFGIGVYDAQYIALAQALGTDLWVADERLLRALAGRLPTVRWLGDYP